MAQYFLVVCTTNRIDELLPVAGDPKNTEEAVINGYTAYRECYTGIRDLSCEDYRNSLYAYVRDPVGYSDWTHALIIVEGSKAEILDLEALLKDDGFWDNLD